MILELWNRACEIQELPLVSGPVVVQKEGYEIKKTRKRGAVRSMRSIINIENQKTRSSVRSMYRHRKPIKMRCSEVQEVQRDFGAISARGGRT